MEDLFTRVWTNLVGRLTGPMQFRLVLQPLMACILAIRAGLRDARAGKPPFLWALTFDPAHRRELFRKGWKDIGRVFIFAVIMDAIYQMSELHFFYPGEALIIAALLALVPYLLIRAPVTRFVEWRQRSKAAHDEQSGEKAGQAVPRTRGQSAGR